MRWLPVHIQLVVLIVVNEAAALLEYREVCVVALREQVQVIAMRELRAHFHRLPGRRVELPKRVDVRPVAFLPALPQPHLRLLDITLQVVVYDVKVLEGREFRVGG